MCNPDWISNQNATSPHRRAVCQQLYVPRDHRDFEQRGLVPSNGAGKGEEEGVRADRRKQCGDRSGRPPFHRKCSGKGPARNTTVREARASRAALLPGLLLPHFLTRASFPHLEINAQPTRGVFSGGLLPTGTQQQAGLWSQT